MAKVVQFLEIGNLPKSQLNPCRFCKVMTKNLNFKKRISIQFFTTFLNFLCRYPAPTAPQSFGCPNCKINSITTTPLKHSSFNENEQI